MTISLRADEREREKDRRKKKEKNKKGEREGYIIAADDKCILNSIHEWTSWPSKESCLSNCLALIKVVEP